MRIGACRLYLINQLTNQLFNWSQATAAGRSKRRNPKEGKDLLRISFWEVIWLLWIGVINPLIPLLCVPALIIYIAGRFSTRFFSR